MRSLLTILAIFSLCAACHKDEDTLPVTPFPDAWMGPQTHGWVKAKRNGKDWIGSSRGGIENEDPTKVSIGFHTFDTDTVFIEELFLIWIPFKLGKFVLTDDRPKAHSIYWVGYFDETDAFYEISRVHKSYVWIDSYDPATKTVTGRFEAFYRKTRNVLFNYPETVSFTDGSFSVTLY